MGMDRRILATIFLVAGAMLVILTSLMGANLSALILALWALLPYGLLYWAGRIVANPWVIGGAGATAIAAEVGVRAAVFLFPCGSTAGLAAVVDHSGADILEPVNFDRKAHVTLRHFKAISSRELV